jgi:ABC-type branched-subunit amino acid transport system substrate-binding protein
VNKRPDLEPLSWFRANPDVKVAPAYADTQGTERGAFEAALGLVQRNGTRPQVFVGPSYSSESVVVSLLANVFEFATVSYSATSTRLSEKSTFPNFFRNVPSDAAQGRAMADLIRTKLSQTKVIVLHTDESYGLGLLNVFRVRANETGLEIPLVATLPPDFKRDDAVSALALVRERVYGVNGGIQDVGTFLYLGASPSEFAVVLAVAQEQKLIGHPFIWVTGDGGSTLALDKPEELNITAQNLVGMFGTQLAAATNDKFQKALNEPYQALLRNNTKVLVYGEELDYPATISVYAPYAYDACAIVLTALNSLYSREIYNFTIAEMNDELRATKYDGTTGLNAFDKLQDREAVYDILNSYNGTWNKAFSYAEGKLQTGGGSGEAIFSSATDAKNTVPPVFALPPPPFNPGYIALIVVCLAVALLAAALVAAYFLRKAAKARKLKALEAQNAEPLFWTSTEEIEEIAPFEAQYDMDAKQVVATSSAEERTQYEVVRDSAVPLFGVARGTRCPVNEELLDVITLINHSAKPVRYTITVPTSGEEYAFELTAKPGGRHAQAQGDAPDQPRVQAALHHQGQPLGQGGVRAAAVHGVGARRQRAQGHVRRRAPRGRRVGAHRPDGARALRQADRRGRVRHRVPRQVPRHARRRQGAAQAGRDARGAAQGVQRGDCALREAAQQLHRQLHRRVARARPSVHLHRAARARHRV